MNKLLFKIISVVLLLSITSKAYGYIDPGFGSYAIQILIASLLGVVFAIKTFFRRLFSAKKDRVAMRTDCGIKSGTVNSNPDAESARSSLKE